MAFTEYTVYSFDEYIKCITDIGRSRGGKADIPNVLWFRGHRGEDWNLRPTLLRAAELNQKSVRGIEDSSRRAVEEELRRQHYIAKNYHFFPKEPKANLEWLEVMQHHGVSTRILDWSESALHSLIFALECFFNNKEYRTEDRIQCSPCIWVLEPIAWNRKALKKITGNQSLIDSCVDSLPHMPARKKLKIKERMKLLNTEMDDYLSMRSAYHLERLFNLSSISGELQTMETEDLIWHLASGEFYYCLFYLLVHIYMKTIPLEINEVLPLSIVESYHSERIKAQKGAFSIFPYYKEDAVFNSVKKTGIYLDAMENMNDGSPYLHKILLYDPDKIAYEVMNAGLNVTWLYPEMPVVANTVEQRKIFT